jgi:hypothetical protein
MYPRQGEYRSIPCEPPTDDCVRACQRRNLLITPDRRSFIQSMNHECARRITGNSVPATSERGVFAYSFPTQYYAQGAALPSSSRYHTGIMGGANASPSSIGTPRGGGRGADRIGYNDALEGYGTPNALMQSPAPAQGRGSERRSSAQRRPHTRDDES